MVDEPDGRAAVDRLGVERAVGALEMAYEVADQRLLGVPRHCK